MSACSSKDSIAMATATPVYSNGTWGSVVGGNLNGVYAPRPVEGVMRTEEYTVENATIELTCPEPGYDPLVLQLGDKTFSRQVPDVSPIWEQWESAGQLPDLTPIPEPEELQLAREMQSALDRLNQSFHDWTAAGWDTGLGYRIPLKWDDPVFVQLKATAQTYQGFLQLGVKSPEDLVPIEDQKGDLQEIPAGVLLAKAFEVELLRQSASERFTRAKAEIARLSKPAEAQAWQPPAWEGV